MHSTPSAVSKCCCAGHKRQASPAPPSRPPWPCGTPHACASQQPAHTTQPNTQALHFLPQIDFKITVKEHRRDTDGCCWPGLGTDLSWCWPYLFYYAAYGAAVVYFAVTAVLGWYSVDLVLLSGAAALWGALFCVGLWPPLASLLPVQQEGWRIVWRKPDDSTSTGGDVTPSAPNSQSSGDLADRDQSDTKLQLWKGRSSDAGDVHSRSLMILRNHLRTAYQKSHGAVLLPDGDMERRYVHLPWADQTIAGQMAKTNQLLAPPQKRRQARQQQQQRAGRQSEQAAAIAQPGSPPGSTVEDSSTASLEHSMLAVPSFEQREPPKGHIAFLVLSTLMIVCLVAAAVVDYRRVMHLARLYSS